MRDESRSLHADPMREAFGAAVPPKSENGWLASPKEQCNIGLHVGPIHRNRLSVIRPSIVYEISKALLPVFRRNFIYRKLF